MSHIIIPGFVFRPAWWLGALQPWGQRDKRYKAPRVLVVHCGDRRPDLAGYLANPIDRAPPDPTDPPAGLSHCKDGKWRRMVATHGAWAPELQQIVQMVPLDLEAWGTGSSLWRRSVCQRMALHVELSGPPTQDPRAAVELAELRRFAIGAKELCPTLEWWITHAQIDPEKTDPGPGVPDDWADGVLVRG